MVFYCRHLLSWRPLHFLPIFGRLQSCCWVVRPSAMECLYYIEFVCSHSLPQAADVWWHQFRWTLMQDEELSNLPYHSHPQAFHLSTIDQLLWRHHPSLHQGSFQRVAHRFLGMKNDCMQIKTKQLDFYKTYFHETYLKNCIVQIKNKLFTLEIGWTKTILQKFWKGNKFVINQKWRERASESRQFTMFITNILTNANVSFLWFYY